MSSWESDTRVYMAIAFNIRLYIHMCIYIYMFYLDLCIIYYILYMYSHHGSFG